MNTRRHYRQLLMFVVVLILPSILVAWLGWTNVKLDGQNRLNEAQRAAAAARNSTRAEIGKDLWDRLENIKSREIGHGISSDPAVRFIAFVGEDARLVLPWEGILTPKSTGHR